MSLVRWDPFAELEDVSTRLNRFFGRRPMGAEGSMTVTEWTPVVDVEENNEGYLVKAELPGLKREDIKVTVNNGMLMLQGERRAEKEEKGKRFHRIERSYGSFYRSFTLPEGVNDEKLNAEFKDGVLTIMIPKAPEVKPKAVQIQVK